MWTGPSRCFTEAGGGTNWDLTWLQVQLSLQQCSTWKSIISVFFQSAKELRLCKCYAQKNFHLHRTRAERRRVTEEFFLILPLALNSRQSPGPFFSNSMLKSCYSFQWFHLLWPLHWLKWKEGCILKILQQTEMSFSEIIQGSKLPTMPNYTWLYS